MSPNEQLPKFIKKLQYAMATTRRKEKGKDKERTNQQKNEIFLVWTLIIVKKIVPCLNIEDEIGKASSSGFLFQK